MGDWAALLSPRCDARGLVGLYCISCSIIRKECSPRTLESQFSILIGFSGNPEVSLSIGPGIMLVDYVCLHL